MKLAKVEQEVIVIWQMRQNSKMDALILGYGSPLVVENVPVKFLG